MPPWRSRKRRAPDRRSFRRACKKTTTSIANQHRHHLSSRNRTPNNTKKQPVVNQRTMGARAGEGNRDDVLKLPCQKSRGSSVQSMCAGSVSGVLSSRAWISVLPGLHRRWSRTAAAFEIEPVADSSPQEFTIRSDPTFVRAGARRCLQRSNVESNCSLRDLRQFLSNGRRHAGAIVLRAGRGRYVVVFGSRRDRKSTRLN